VAANGLIGINSIHQLTQLWFERYNALTKCNLHHGCIGELRVSSSNEQLDRYSTGSKIADRVLSQMEKISIENERNKKWIKRETRALRNYFQDMNIVVKELARVIIPVLPTSPRESRFSIAYSHPDGRNPTTWRRS
jgi:hypothetical protein